MCLNIYKDLLFHLDRLSSPDELREKIQTLFGMKYEMRGHQLENELISLSPSSFKSLKVYFSKFKSLVLQLKQCGIDKKDEKLVLAILLNLGHDYSVFFLTFHATKLTARAWKMPKLAKFMESLTQEQDKLVMMGTIKPSKYQALVFGDSMVDSKRKKKAKNTPEQKRSPRFQEELPEEEEQRRNEQVCILE